MMIRKLVTVTDEVLVEMGEPVAGAPPRGGAPPGGIPRVH
jgi:hypothetical protein